MKHQSVTKTKYWHTIFSQLFSFTLSHKLSLSEYSPSRPFLHALCVFDRLDASEAQSVLCLSVLERAAQAHTRARKHTHTHTTLQPGEQRLSCGLYFQHFIIKHVQQFMCQIQHSMKILAQSCLLFQWDMSRQEELSLKSDKSPRVCFIEKHKQHFIDILLFMEATKRKK